MNNLAVLPHDPAAVAQALTAARALFERQQAGDMSTEEDLSAYIALLDPSARRVFDTERKVANRA